LICSGEQMMMIEEVIAEMLSPSR